MKREDGTYQDSHAWFTSYAPYNDPEVVVTVFLKEGGEGSSYAVPIADKVLRAYFEYAGSRKRGSMLREDRCRSARSIRRRALASRWLVRLLPCQDENSDQSQDNVVDEEAPIDETGA